MLFCGSSGVGKSATINILSKELGFNLIKLDMSEYTSEFCINKLIGASLAYQGSDEEFILENVRFNPKSIIVLDNMEKGSKKIINLFLKGIDEGYINDAKGEIIDMSHAIIIFTSNIKQKCNVGFSKKQNNLKYFDDDFVKRVDDVIYFNDIDTSMIEEYIKKNNCICDSEFLKSCEYKKYGFRAVKKLIKNKNK